jgi:hypothetical protein
MIITAKFASVCPCCSQRIVPGSKVEWSKGSPAKHTACAQGPAAAVVAGPARRASPKGGYRKACKTDGNCSSVGSGRSCGGHDCDGY